MLQSAFIGHKDKAFPSIHTFKEKDSQEQPPPNFEKGKIETIGTDFSRNLLALLSKPLLYMSAIPYLRDVI